MLEAYKDSDIQFLPDRVVQELNQGKLTSSLPEFHNFLSERVSTEILSKSDIISNSLYDSDRIQGLEFIPSIHSLTEYFHHFWY